MKSPLGLSPATSSETCCQSESSSITDCSCPNLADNPFTLSSVCDLDLSCSMESPHDSSLSRLDQQDARQSQWKWTPTVAVQQSVNRSSASRSVSAEYEPFPPYNSTYSDHYSFSAVLPAASRSPAPIKTPLVHPPFCNTSSSTASKQQRDHTRPGYSSLGLTGSRYPALGIGRASKPPAANSHSTLPPQMTHMEGPSRNPGDLDDSVVDWHKSADRYLMVPDQDSLPPAEGSSLLPLAHSEAHATTRVSARIPRRRVPRKLTTKQDAHFECSVEGCGKLFSRSYNYKAHLETHREKRDYPFHCQVQDCTKRFVRKTDFRRHHQSVHMKERNHKCGYCGRGFSRRDTLGRYAARTMTWGKFRAFCFADLHYSQT